MQDALEHHPLFAGIEHLTRDQFWTDALHWLNASIGFDGVMWGNGTVNGSRIEIHDRFLEGRPISLIGEHSGFSSPDDFVSDFISMPEAVRNIQVAEYYADSRFAPLCQHLEAHRVRHILVKGVRHAKEDELAWIGFLRADRHRPFDPSSLTSTAGVAAAVVLHVDEYICSANSRLLKPIDRAASIDQGPGEPITRMTERQKQVLHCLLQGWPNKLIARRLAITENTLKSHLRAIYQFLDVSSRSQAILKTAKLLRESATN
jgi:DNA-binding CsgD family transcriptional regulator